MADIKNMARIKTKLASTTKITLLYNMVGWRISTWAYPSQRRTYPGEGTWYLGGYLCSIWGFADPPIYLPKFSAQIHPSTKFFGIFFSWTHLSTKNLRSNPSIYQKFTLFAENDPPIYLHQPFKTFQPPLPPGYVPPSENSKYTHHFI